MRFEPARPMPLDVRRLWDQVLPPDLRQAVSDEWTNDCVYEEGDLVEFIARGPECHGYYGRRGRVVAVIKMHGGPKTG